VKTRPNNEGLPDVQRVSGALGAEVRGLDLALPIGERALAALKLAFLEHHVLVIPDQGHLTPAQLSTFANLWGPLQSMPEGSPMLSGHREVFVLDFEGKKPPTDIWHSDLTLEERPPLGSILLGRVIPVGGDTIFANQHLAYDLLSEGMQRLLSGMRAVHDGHFWTTAGKFTLDQLPCSVHPVVRTHPETGRKALFVNSAYTARFEDMTPEESEPLLSWLWRHSVQPNLTFRHRWRQGDLVMWDNRSVQHFAVADYGSARRVMHRLTILGDRPV
jgi:taurine dioxygenase